MAESTLPSTVRGHFVKDVTGPVPQNTGIADLDTHIDRVIGKSSEQGWKTQERRVKDKREVLRETGVTGGHLSRTVDGAYIALNSEEKAVHDRALAIHGAAMDWKTRLKNRRPTR